jgi:hypothetical protein
MSININLIQFQANAEAHPHNVVDQGDINDVIQAINNTNGASQYEKIRAYFDCLAQVFEMNQGEHPFKGRCISALKTRIFEAAKNFPRTTMVAANDPHLKNNDKLRNIIEKTNYIMKGRFFSSWRHLFIRNTKFSYQLSKIYGNPSRPIASSGMTYVVTAATACVGAGLTQLLSASDSSRFVGIPLIGFGGTIVGGTLVSALTASGGDEP